MSDESGDQSDKVSISKKRKSNEPRPSSGVVNKKLKSQDNQSDDDNDTDSNFSDQPVDSNSDSEGQPVGSSSDGPDEVNSDEDDSSEEEDEEVVKSSGSRSRPPASSAKKSKNDKDDEDSDSDSDFERQLKTNPIKVNPVWTFEVKDLKKAIKAVRKGMPLANASKIYGMSSDVIKKHAAAYPKRRKITKSSKD